MDVDFFGKVDQKGRQKADKNGQKRTFGRECA